MLRLQERSVIMLAMGPTDGAGVARRAPTPGGMQGVYAQLVTSVPGLRNPPILEFYDDLRGVGGLFMSEGWTIAVGRKDMEDIATNLIAANRTEVTAIVQDVTGVAAPSPALIHHTVEGAATARCIVHELGHALIFAGHPNPFAPDQEAGADFYAGVLDAERGVHQRLGEMFFWTIVCRGMGCTHPSPVERLAVYRTGRRERFIRPAVVNV